MPIMAKYVFFTFLAMQFHVVNFLLLKTEKHFVTVC